jgi:hypothetical protein
VVLRDLGVVLRDLGVVLRDLGLVLWGLGLVLWGFGLMLRDFGPTLPGFRPVTARRGKARVTRGVGHAFTGLSLLSDPEVVHQSANMCREERVERAHRGQGQETNGRREHGLLSRRR